MNSQDEQDLEQRFQQLEAEVQPPPGPAPVVQLDQPSSIDRFLNRVVGWFQNLPKTGKVIAIAVVVILGLTILRLFVQLVVSAIGIALIGGLAYIAYKAFLDHHPSETP